MKPRIKRASKEPKGCASHGDIGARNPCRIEYMGVYEILILPGGREGGRAKGSESLERECEVTLRALARAAAKPTLDEGGRVVKPPLFAPLSPSPPLHPAAYANSN